MHIFTVFIGYSPCFCFSTACKLTLVSLLLFTVVSWFCLCSNRQRFKWKVWHQSWIRCGDQHTDDTVLYLENQQPEDRSNFLRRQIEFVKKVSNTAHHTSSCYQMVDATDNVCWLFLSQETFSMNVTPDAIKKSPRVTLNQSQFTRQIVTRKLNGQFPVLSQWLCAVQLIYTPGTVRQSVILVLYIYLSRVKCKIDIAQFCKLV